MKRTMLLTATTVALGCGGDTSATKPATTTPSAVEPAPQKPKAKETAKPAPVQMDEPPPPSAVKKKEAGEKKDDAEPKAPPPVDKPIQPKTAAPQGSGSG